MERARSSRSGSTCANPTAVLMSTGKNATRNATVTFDVSPMPNHTRISGAKAIFGMICSVTRSGVSARRSVSE